MDYRVAVPYDPSSVSLIDWLLVAVVAAFFIGAGYVVASAGPVGRLAVLLVPWCAALAALLWLAGYGWQAVAAAGSFAAAFAAVLIPAGTFNTVRAWRERRMLRRIS